MTELPGSAYRVFEGLETYFCQELAQRFVYEKSVVQYGTLFYCPELPLREPFWAQTALSGLFSLDFDSINSAAKALRTVQRNWICCPFDHFRRSALIQEKLPYINTNARSFPGEIPSGKVGLWTLLDSNRIFAARQSSSPFAGGVLTLEEDTENPPSRAYLKLQEALLRFKSRFGKFPQNGERCFDAGACPGGWTWVLAQLGCSVFAVDRSELDSRLMKNPLVTFVKHDAFTLDPAKTGPFDWVFSDVICYPERLLDWIKKWISSGLAKNMICTVKMQGKPDWKLLEQFAQIPGSFLTHLQYNKHELTWFHCPE